MAKARKLLIYEMIHTISRCGKFLYQKHQGNPSGNPITTELNCIVDYLGFLTVIQKF
jgi:hypothetical protein